MTLVKLLNEVGVVLSGVSDLGFQPLRDIGDAVEVALDGFLETR